MKIRAILLLCVLVVPACGSKETAAGSGAEANPASSAAAAAPAPSKTASDSGAPCSALSATPVQYDAAGKPVAYTFAYPSGWQVNELFVKGATSLDITRSIDDDPAPEFVLRFGHVPDKQLDRPENLAETWKKVPMVEEVSQIDVQGRTMYVSRNRMGRMVGFQALFPDVTTDSKAWLVSGGVVDAPDECADEAVAAVERIIRSFAPNPDIGTPPEE